MTTPRLRAFGVLVGAQKKVFGRCTRTTDVCYARRFHAMFTERDLEARRLPNAPRLPHAT